jgi:hypothetical protein
MREILPLFRSTQQRQSDLRDQIHREFVNRPFQFNKRSQLFIGTHNETLPAKRQAGTRTGNSIVTIL